MHDDDPVESWTQRIATEFQECPGLRLTAAQAARFWGLELASVELVLKELVDRALLVRTPEGVFTPAGHLRRRP